MYTSYIVIKHPTQARNSEDIGHFHLCIWSGKVCMQSVGGWIQFRKLKMARLKMVRLNQMQAKFKLSVEKIVFLKHKLFLKEQTLGKKLENHVRNRLCNHLKMTVTILHSLSLLHASVFGMPLLTWVRQRHGMWWSCFKGAIDK